MIEVILGLQAAPLELYARLSLRAGPVFRVSTLRYALPVVEAITVLEAADLLISAIPDDRAAGAFPMAELKEACKRLKLPVGGSRDALIARLKGRRWRQEPVVMLAHLRLLRRMELLFFQQSWLDRSALVVDRLGVRRFASYTETGGAGLFSDRRSLRRYERGKAGEWEEGEALKVALTGPRRGAPWSDAVAMVAEGADPQTLSALVAAGAPLRPRLALELERAGKVEEAFALCRGGDPDPAQQLALDRSGQRIGKKLGRGWTPRATVTIPERSLRLPRGESLAGRPGWRVEGRDYTVEAAVIASLRTQGVEAIHTENWLWTSLFALAFRELYWLPIPGMLPGPFLMGPLDLGSPAFFRNRQAEVEARLRLLREEGFVAVATGWEGEALAGLADGSAAISLGARLPGRLIARVLERLAREGWSSARGLPDLLVFGQGARPAGLIPPALPASVLLVEVKGPTDALQDGQRVWFQQLLSGGESVEIWHVME